MSRIRVAGIAFLICLAGTIGQPAFVDQIRYPMALVLSWPARIATSWTAAPPTPQNELEARAAEFDAIWQGVLRAEKNPQGFRVFSHSEKRSSIFIEGGANAGLKRGDVVHDGSVLLGFVDVVTENAARVNLISHGRSQVAGQIVAPPGTQLPIAASLDLLLAGIGDGELAARQGSRIDRAFLGYDVRYLDEKGLWSLKIGTIAEDQVGGGLVVRTAFDPAQVDRVLIGVSGLEAPDTLTTGSFEAAKVLSFGRTSSSGRTWLLSKGGKDGIKTGAWVSRQGSLVGRIVRVGYFTSHMQPLTEAEVEIPAFLLSPSQPLPESVVWHGQDDDLGPGHRFTRGRGPANGLPCGLWLGKKDGSGIVTYPELPTIDESVKIHDSLDIATRFRLGLGR